MKNPRVSVLMSVYNGEKHLHQAVDSILNQTFKDFEFLIINDGSTDKTAQILQSNYDPRIKIINNDKNIGLTKSLNKGLKIARGKYIARMDADDISMPERLEKEVRLLERRKNVGLVGTYCLVINENGKVFYEFKSSANEKILKKNLLAENQFTHGSAMFRRRCLEKAGDYREEFVVAQDYDLWLRIAEFSDLAIIPEFLYQWRLDIQSISANKLAQQNKFVSLALELAKERKQFGKDSIQVLKERRDKKGIENLLLKTKPRKGIEAVYGHHYWARILLDGNCPGDALRLILKSLITYPRSKTSWCLFFRALRALMGKVEEI